MVSAGNYTDDIDDQGTFNNTHSTIETANNYGYDELGNLVRDAQEEIASIEWTVYGKMKKITRNSGSSKADLEFGYDASGNRLWKKVSPKGSGAVTSTYYYLRDAQGNEMCRYVKYTNTTSQLMYVAQEHSIYGSSRVGVDNRKDTLYKAGSYSPAWGGANTSRRALGLKSFELSNHLGNVLVTVSDKPIYNVASATIFFQPEITSTSDYYPFGAPIAGRGYSSEAYRCSFQGQEADNEIIEQGSCFDFKYRVNDTRIGRFWSVDPIAAKFPWNSAYAFAENQVIAFVELEGLEKATPQQQQNAKNAVIAFANDKTTSTVWNKIPKQSFVSSLTQMLNDPVRNTKQGNTNLCGIAVSCKASIEYDPETFVSMALSIYQTGKYEEYEANSDLYEKSASNDLNEAGFVVMSTMRNSLNILPYDPTDDGGISGMTLPNDVDQLLTQTMHMRKTTNTDWPSTPDSGPTLCTGITKAVNAGHIVILTVNVSHFEQKSTWSVIPDHFIQVTGIKDNPDGTINVDWWSWGENRDAIKMTKEQLYKSTYFHGSFE